MEIVNAAKHQWNDIKDIYMEAFPKQERKPSFAVRHSVKTGKAKLLTAVEDGALLGFIMAIPYGGTVLVDYLAVSDKIRSRGTGSRLLQEVCKRFTRKTIVLLIEKPDACAENNAQRIARRRFYLKNGFTSSNIFITGHSGNMEILNYGRMVSVPEYMDLQRYALGNIMFRLSKIKLAV